MVKKTAFSLLLALALVLTMVPAALAQGTIVLINPPSQSVNQNATVTAEVKIDSVTDLYGVDLRLSFDAAKLEALDANTSLSGVQVEQGAFMNPAQGFMASNVVDNTAGTVQYAFALLSPAPAVTGSGVLIRITFRAKAAGNALVTLNSATLSNNQALPITSTLANGSITIVPVASPTAAPTAAPTPVPGPGTTYVVKWGDTLYSIARRFGVTVNAIVAANGLTNPNYIRVGQTLIIPGAAPGPTPVPPPPSGSYVVLPGDTLYAIAAKFKTTVDAIVALNKIVNPNYIRAGQVLLIPTGGTPPVPPSKTHVVVPGDTVYGIAAKYGVAYWSIVTLNNLANPNLIFVGQTLLIP